MVAVQAECSVTGADRRCVHVARVDAMDLSAISNPGRALMIYEHLVAFSKALSRAIRACRPPMGARWHALNQELLTMAEECIMLAAPAIEGDPCPTKPLIDYFPRCVASSLQQSLTMPPEAIAQVGLEATRLSHTIGPMRRRRVAELGARST